METKTKPKPHGRRYKWVELFATGSFCLLRGRDYAGQSHGMASTVRQAAKRLRVRVKLTVSDGMVLVNVVR